MDGIKSAKLLYLTLPTLLEHLEFLKSRTLPLTTSYRQHIALHNDSAIGRTKYTNISRLWTLWR